MTSLILSALIVLVASALHAATGFGFSLLAVPLLLLVHEPLVAVQVNLILSVLLSLLLVGSVWSDVDRSLLHRLVLSSAAGVPLGTLVLWQVPPLAFKGLVGVLVLVLVALLWRQWRFARTPARDLASGVLAGGFTSAIGMGGVPLLVYLAGTDMPKATARATVLVFFLFSYTLALFLQVAGAPGRADIWWLSLGLSPVALAGVWVGRWLFGRIDQRQFRACIHVALIGNGLLLLGAAARGLGTKVLDSLP
jgi:uncharacterized membrane protein YfcA